MVASLSHSPALTPWGIRIENGSFGLRSPLVAATMNPRARQVKAHTSSRHSIANGLGLWWTRRSSPPGKLAESPQEDQAMAKGTLIAAMNIAQAAEDEFHDWYDTEHMPERQPAPGFLACQPCTGAHDRN